MFFTADIVNLKIGQNKNIDGALATPSFHLVYMVISVLWIPIMIVFQAGFPNTQLHPNYWSWMLNQIDYFQKHHSVLKFFTKTLYDKLWDVVVSVRIMQCQKSAPSGSVFLMDKTFCLRVNSSPLLPTRYSRCLSRVTACRIPVVRENNLGRINQKWNWNTLHRHADQHFIMQE